MKKAPQPKLTFEAFGRIELGVCGGSAIRLDGKRLGIIERELDFVCTGHGGCSSGVGYNRVTGYKVMMYARIDPPGFETGDDDMTFKTLGEARDWVRAYVVAAAKHGTVWSNVP